MSCGIRYRFKTSRMVLRHACFVLDAARLRFYEFLISGIHESVWQLQVVATNCVWPTTLSQYVVVATSKKPSTHTDSYTPAVYRSYFPNRYVTPIPTDQPSGIGIPKSCSRSRQKLHLAVNFPEIVSRGVGVTEMPTPGR